MGLSTSRVPPPSVLILMVPDDVEKYVGRLGNYASADLMFVLSLLISTGRGEEEMARAKMTIISICSIKYKS